MDLGVVGNRRSAAGDLMLPVKLMEYIALRIPAVVPRLKAIEYYFSDDMVAFYEPEDVASLADAIYRLYRDPELRCRQAERAAEFLRDVRLGAAGSGAGELLSEARGELKV